MTPQPPEQAAPTVEKPSVLALLDRLAEEAIEETGLERVNGAWMPWVRLDGIKFFNLRLQHMAGVRPHHALPPLQSPDSVHHDHIPE